MQKQKVTLGKLALVGLSVRTNNKNEMNPGTSKIAGLAGMYWSEQVASAFKHRRNPGITYSVYTAFESDEHGDYTYFIGEAVDSINGQDLERFETIDIVAGEYQKFTTPEGKMPTVVLEAWQKIWQMQSCDFEGQRAYKTDFEIYDKKAENPESAIVDIYIGIK